MPPSKHPLNGGNAPDFDLELYSAPSGGSERTVSLQASRGRVVLLDFWATWCKPCKASFPSYQHLQEKFGEQIQVIAISEDDETDGIASFIADTGVDFPVAWDADKSVARRYQIEGMPTLFIIDGSGIVHNVHSGFRAGDEAQIRRSIESALAVR